MGPQGSTMKTTRRDFGKVALGTAIGAMSAPALIGGKAQAQTRAAHASGVYHDGIMQLNQNESARGPGPKTMEAIHEVEFKVTSAGKRVQTFIASLTLPSTSLSANLADTRLLPFMAQGCPSTEFPTGIQGNVSWQARADFHSVVAVGGDIVDRGAC